jgi:hypothetical protein
MVKAADDETEYVAHNTVPPGSGVKPPGDSPFATEPPLPGMTPYCYVPNVSNGGSDRRSSIGTLCRSLVVRR